MQKDIKGYEGIYYVTSDGEVFSYPRYIGGQRNRFLRGLKHMKTFTTNVGYKALRLSDHAGNKKHYTVHRLVALTFIPNPENKFCVNHKDGNKLNNRVENLEWCSVSENFKHAHKMGLMNPVKGSRHAHAKVNEDDIKEIREMAASGRITLTGIAEIYGLEASVVSRIVNRRTWKHVA